jgi:hypothetical protein
MDKKTHTSIRDVVKGAIDESSKSKMSVVARGSPRNIPSLKVSVPSGPSSVITPLPIYSSSAVARPDLLSSQKALTHLDTSSALARPDQLSRQKALTPLDFSKARAVAELVPLKRQSSDRRTFSFKEPVAATAAAASPQSIPETFAEEELESFEDDEDANQHRRANEQLNYSAWVRPPTPPKKKEERSTPVASASIASDALSESIEEPRKTTFGPSKEQLAIIEENNSEHLPPKQNRWTEIAMSPYKAPSLFSIKEGEYEEENDLNLQEVDDEEQHSDSSSAGSNKFVPHQPVKGSPSTDFVPQKPMEVGNSTKFVPQKPIRADSLPLEQSFVRAPISVSRAASRNARKPKQGQSGGNLVDLTKIISGGTRTPLVAVHLVDLTFV